MRDEGLQKSEIDLARDMFRMLSEERPFVPNADERVLYDYDPRWYLEVLRGISGELLAGRPVAQWTWEGVTDLFVARRVSNWKLMLPLIRLEWLPWSKARTWAHRQPLRIHAAPGVLFIALKAMPKSGAPSLWYGARFECRTGEHDVV